MNRMPTLRHLLTISILTTASTGCTTVIESGEEDGPEPLVDQLTSMCTFFWNVCETLYCAS